MRFGVTKNKEEGLKKKMIKLAIDDKDIEEKFIRSGGKGGQYVNKVSTCVYLKYLPMGIEVKCQQARSQVLNRFLASRILVNKIETIMLGKLSQEQKRREKIIRQKRRRSQRSKEKMLRDKAKNSQKKMDRSFKGSKDLSI